MDAMTTARWWRANALRAAFAVISLVTAHQRNQETEHRRLRQTRDHVVHLHEIHRVVR